MCEKLVLRVAKTYRHTVFEVGVSTPFVYIANIKIHILLRKDLQTMLLITKISNIPGGIRPNSQLDLKDKLSR